MYINDMQISRPRFGGLARTLLWQKVDFDPCCSIMIKLPFSAMDKKTTM
jgi:hypothetical protein